MVFGEERGGLTLPLLGIIWFLFAEKGTRDLRVLETDYEHYAIMYTFKQGDEESGTTLQLLSRCWEKGCVIHTLWEEMVLK